MTVMNKAAYALVALWNAIALWLAICIFGVFLNYVIIPVFNHQVQVTMTMTYSQALNVFLMFTFTTLVSATAFFYYYQSNKGVARILVTGTIYRIIDFVNYLDESEGVIKQGMIAQITNNGLYGPCQFFATEGQHGLEIDKHYILRFSRVDGKSVFEEVKS